MDRTVKIRLDGDNSGWVRAALGGAAAAKTLSASLDTSNDRMSNLIQTSLALGPALVPVGAAGVTVLSGLTNQLAFAAAGAGVAVVAFQGVGDALDALNDYHLEPTEANLAKLAETMNTLGPHGQSFVQFLQDLRPQMQDLQDIAQAGLFPGIEAGITSLLQRAPGIERIFAVISDTVGDLIAEGGANLADPRWDQFFDFLEREARPTLEDAGRAVGNLTEGFVELWMAFQPLSDQFSTGFLDMSRDFATWADELSRTEGFQSFLDYVQRVGPKAGDALGAIANALVELIEAAAPVGEHALPVIEATANAIAAIADSPIGPAAIGILALTSAYARLVAVGRSGNVQMIGSLFGATALGGATRAAKDLPGASRAFLDFGSALDTTGRKATGFATSTQRLRASLSGAGRLAGGAAGLAFVMSDLDDKMGLTNTAMGAMIGTIGGPWGAAIGAGVGLALDFAAANDESGDALERVNAIASDSSLSIQSRIAAVDAEIAALKRLRAERLAGESISTVAQSEVTGGASRRDPNVEAFDADIKKATETRRELAEADREAAFAEAGLADVMNSASQATRDQTYELIRNTNEARNNANEKSQAIGGEVAYEAAVDATAAAIRKYGRNTNLSTEGGRALAIALRTQIDDWNALTPAAQKARGGIDKAREGMYEAARAAGRSKQAARDMANEMVDLGKLNPKPKVDAETKQAMEKINAVLRRMGLIRDKSVTITTNHVVKGFTSGHPTRGRRNADGGYIAGPGGPRDDAIPAWLSNGEFVVNAAATKKFLPELQLMNAHRFADGGFAASGPATAPTVNVAAPATPVDIDYEKLAHAITKGNEGATYRLAKDGRTLQLTTRRG